MALGLGAAHGLGRGEHCVGGRCSDAITQVAPLGRSRAELGAGHVREAELCVVGPGSDGGEDLCRFRLKAAILCQFSCGRLLNRRTGRIMRISTTCWRVVPVWSDFGHFLAVMYMLCEFVALLSVLGEFACFGTNFVVLSNKTAFSSKLRVRAWFYRTHAALGENDSFPQNNQTHET